MPLQLFDTTTTSDPACTVRAVTGKITIRPHYALEPTFLLLAGVTASVAQQAISFPMAQLQSVHYSRLESLDYKTRLESTLFASYEGPSGLLRRWGRLRERYAHSYGGTLEQASMQARIVGGWRKWLYRGFVWQTVRQVPGTSAGLIVFELVRRRWALDVGQEVRVEYDGYDLLLT